MKKQAKKFKNKCLKKGYESYIEGCVTQGNIETMSDSRYKRCGNRERKLAACDYRCPVDGGWSDYGEWSTCSAGCGGGEQTRERECNNPAPQFAGAECQGDSSQTQSCNEQPCPVGGGWGDWSEWSECSAVCGGGIQTRSKECNNPAPAYGGADCDGEATEIQKCNTQSCPVDGGWSDYGEWSTCSAGCGGGEQTRERECNNPPPQFGGAECQGDSSQTQSCNEQPCPVDGDWSDYGEWSTCSEECGGGTQTRSKECNNPTPAYGGADCEGDATQTRNCNSQACPIDGEWGAWSAWSTCSEECGGGTQTRSKECKNPAPAYGGADCEGDATQTRDCNSQACPIDGEWGAWSAWSTCSEECGGGTQTRSKECNNPAPAYGGADCEGDATQTRDCNSQACPIDGEWGAWSAWSTCSEECGGGTQTRSKECNNPAPAYGGADCEGDATQTRNCNSQACPVDGEWGTWSAWSECSKECGGGTKTRSRECNNPTPAHGGNDCQGDSTKTQSCNTQNCEVVYKITHTTGTGTHDGGATSGAYLFTIIGHDGTTGEHDCSADRSKGTTSTCTIRDTAKIGKLKSMRVKNTSNNKWVFVDVSVKVNNVLRGRWAGSQAVDDYKTKTIVFTYIGDQLIEYVITHVTGTGTHDSGARSGMYEFQLKGANNAFYTAWHDCNANRNKGETGTCRIEDAAELGEIEQAGIKNTGDNTWAFTSFKVKVDGKVVANWSGNKKVSDYKTEWINF
ncbi:hypothetical protein ACHWQZ_G001540 [Mnemiopsis leidyi]